MTMGEYSSHTAIYITHAHTGPTLYQVLLIGTTVLVGFIRKTYHREAYYYMSRATESIYSQTFSPDSLYADISILLIPRHCHVGWSEHLVCC